MRGFVFAGLVAFAATTAQAAETLLTGPAPAWVKPLPAVAPGPLPAEGAPLRLLRQDRQLNFGPDGDAAYQESAMQVRTALGLGMAGTISLSWDPSRDTVTLHKLRILRDGKHIDVLARQSFTVIRRETNITEIVDGRLTATIQPEDLRVGDVVEMAYTQVHQDPILKGRTDFDANLGHLRAVEAFTLRATWPSADKMAWRAGSGLAKPKVVRKGDITELTLELKDPQPLKGPAGAPRRYWPTRELEFSEFASWAEVAATVAAPFDRASTLAPDSPLRAEAAKIKALSDDPKVRAAAALKLVQDQVRYLGLLLTDGGYTPVDADKTWARRFGECKAKTALLVALLRELGIEAEPALVNAYGAEGLDRQLPRMSAFNHVIARVTIGGKVYWLDGTRSGDGALDTLSVPSHHWALPIRAEGAQLIALVPPPRTEPDGETFLEVDASAGLEAPAPVRGRMIMRGDAGLWPGLMASSLPPADRDKMLKTMWARYPWIEVKTATATRDPATGESRMEMTGTAKLPWFDAQGGMRWLAVPEAALGWQADFKRDPGPDADAPYSVSYPGFTASRFTLKLPHHGAGFSAPAADVDKTVAGRAFLRRTKIEGDTLTIEASTRAVAREFPASEAEAASTALAEMAKVRVVVQAPRFYRPTDGDIAAWLALTPKTADEHLERGRKLTAAGRSKEGLADFEKAVALDPKSPWAYANRGLARIQIGEFDKAKPDLEEAIRLDPRNPAVQGGLGALALRDGRYADAVTAFTRAGDLSGNNFAAMTGRAEAYQRLGETEKALADLAEALQIDPTAFPVYLARGEIHARAGDRTKALAEVDAALKLAPREPYLHTYRAATLAKLGRRDEAEQAFAQSIDLKPTVNAYLTRAANRPKTDVKGRLGDIEAAEKLEANNVAGAKLRAQVHVEAGDPGQAILLLNRAIRTAPKASDLLEARATAYAKAGRPALATKDFADMRSRASGDAVAFNALCWAQATLGLDLETALSDCLAALEINPRLVEAVDSKGFVLLRLGRARESVAAYDEAIRIRPRQAESLYGRGLAKLRLGQTAEGEADLAAAKAIDGEVESQFAEYGIR